MGNAESANQKFQYLFVTNELDPARLMRACEVPFRNNLMSDHAVHINTDGIRAAYGELPAGGGRAADSRKRVVEHIDSGHLISLPA